MQIDHIAAPYLQKAVFVQHGGQISDLAVKGADGLVRNIAVDVDLPTGVCIGAWQQGRLGAYLILRLCGQSDENYAAFLGVPQSQWQHWANADSAVVHPDWRGNGLQRAMLEAALPLLPPQITHLGATVSPDNSYSLHNAQAGGFVIRCRREMYGGYDRYLLEKQL